MIDREEIGTGCAMSESGTEHVWWAGSPVSSAICFGGYEIQEEPYGTNTLLCASPALLHCSIFIKITYYHAILNSYNSSENQFQSTHFPVKAPAFEHCWESPLIPNSLTLLADAVKELGSGAGICSVTLGLVSWLEWLAKGSSFLSTILNEKRNQMFQYCTSKVLLYKHSAHLTQVQRCCDLGSPQIIKTTSAPWLSRAFCKEPLHLLTNTMDAFDRQSFWTPSS